MNIKKVYLKKDARADLKGRRHEISQDRSDFLIKNFKKNRERLLNPELKKKDQEVGILPFSESFNADVIRKLVALPNCEGLRIYSGLNEDFQMVFVLRAVDENGKDICINFEKPQQKANGVTMMAMSFMPGEAECYSLDDAQRVPPWPATEE